MIDDISIRFAKPEDAKELLNIYEYYVMKYWDMPICIHL